MPISKNDRKRYGDDWDAISLRIRFERAEGQCECDGLCGRERCKPRCEARHGEAHPYTGSTVVLTTAHLADPIENTADDNLKALCQACHLLYDMPRHVAKRQANRQAARAPIIAKANALAFEVECATGRRIAR